MNKWIEQICLLDDPRWLVHNPWSYKGGAVATNGIMLIWLEGVDGYDELDSEVSSRRIESLLTPHQDAMIRNTTVEALRAWAGNFTFERCDQCDGTGYRKHDQCHGSGCVGCDHEGLIACNKCDASSWPGFDHEQLGKINGSSYNLKIIAGVINNVGPGNVTIHAPKHNDERRASPLQLFGEGWTALIMTISIETDNEFQGWID